MSDTAEPVAATADAAEWALLEIMGHRRRAGRVSEVSRFGATLLRIDIPIAGDAPDSYVTEFYGGGSIYALRPCSEEIARTAAGQIGDPRPVAPVTHRLPTPEEVDDDGMPF